MISFKTVPEAAYSFSILAFPLGPMIGILEHRGLALGYSKFRSAVDKSPEISSKTGFLVAYSTPLLVAAATYDAASAADTSLNMVVALSAIHYLKRDLECLFLHKYSNGGMNVVTCALITQFYCLGTFVNVGSARVAPAPSLAITMAGLAIFSVGELGNLYHHYLLSTLRKPGEQGYKLPTGGLFGLVCCPHYLCEVIGALGVAVCSNHVSPFLVWAAFNCYLLGRSASTMSWYRHRFGPEKLPPNWKRLLPFLF
mmetsp:Transcript_18837/g.45266  ORF Transcript_18837/g.45266 Transcript_18837/m.45266 type:complete len:255 (-) Transcript_18837:87-851(-)